MGAARMFERLGAAQGLDRVANPLREAVQRVLPPGRARDALRGRWLGHTLHPMLTDVPIGLWTSAVVLDHVGGRRGQRSADTLIALGAAAALPTAAAGLADWSEASATARRQGVVHATANSIALTLFSASLLARRNDRATGRWLARLGAVALAVGGYVGGHLAYAEGVGVSRRAAVEPAGPPGTKL